LNSSACNELLFQLHYPGPLEMYVFLMEMQ